jgi:hypothetical protein
MVDSEYLIKLMERMSRRLLEVIETGAWPSNIKSNVPTGINIFKCDFRALDRHCKSLYL